MCVRGYGDQYWGTNKSPVGGLGSLLLNEAGKVRRSAFALCMAQSDRSQVQSSAQEGSHKNYIPLHSQT